MQDARGLAALILEQSAAEIDQLRADAQERIARTRAAAAAKVESIRSAAVREGEQRGRRRAASLLAVAEARSRLRVLHAREAHIDDALAHARSQLANLTNVPDAPAVVTALIREALQVLQPGPVRVQLPESLAALLDSSTRRQLGAGRWALHFETAPVPGGGVIVETDDGRLRFDNSIEARFRRAAAYLRQLAAELLHPPADSESNP